MAPDKIYWIQTSDRRCLAMSEGDVDNLVQEMPTLSFLLFGHPQMQPKTLKKSKDGIEILEIDPALQVSRASFIFLVNCLRGATPLPARADESQSKDLAETMVTLGGCESLEQRLRDQSTNPLTPEEDTEDKYLWQVIHQSEFSNFSIPPDYANAGYTFAAMGTKGYNMHQYYLRKPR